MIPMKFIKVNFDHKTLIHKNATENKIKRKIICRRSDSAGGKREIDFE